MRFKAVGCLPWYVSDHRGRCWNWTEMCTPSAEANCNLVAAWFGFFLFWLTRFVMEIRMIWNVTCIVSFPKKLHTILTSHLYFFVCWLEITDVNQNLNSLHPFEIQVTQRLPWRTPASLTYLEGGEPRHAMWLLHARYGQNLRSLWCFIMPLVSCGENQRNHGWIIYSQVCSQGFLGFSSPFELKAGM